MISASAPGKLYIAGEYAVVEPGHRAVLVAVDRFITVRVTVAEHAGRITSDLYATRSLTWYRRLEDDVLEVEEQFDDYVVSAIRVVEQMVREKGGSMRFFDLDVSSELDDGSGRKLGLGSSSAVTVATVRAVAGFYGLPLDDMAVYKLALLASDAVQPIGSGGDIAVSAFTGWVGYTSPDRAWLRRERAGTNTGNGLSRLVAGRWPLLEIHRLPSPGLSLRVGWTGAPASTPRLVAGVQAGAHRTDDAAYTAFLSSSENCLGPWCRHSGRTTPRRSVTGSRRTGGSCRISAAPVGSPSKPPSCEGSRRSPRNTGRWPRAPAPGAGTAESPCARPKRTPPPCAPPGRRRASIPSTCRSISTPRSPHDPR